MLRESACFGCSACRQGRVEPLTVLHHAGLYQQHLCRLMETVRALFFSLLCYGFGCRWVPCSIEASAERMRSRSGNPWMFLCMAVALITELLRLVIED
jgi:hypothetical protein